MDGLSPRRDMTLRELVKEHAKEQYVDSTLKILHDNMIDDVDTLIRVLPSDTHNTMQLPFALVVDLRAYVEKQQEVKRQLLAAEEKEEADRKHTIVESEAVRKAREFFRTVDTDNNGSLDVEEFRVLMAKLGEVDMDEVAKIHAKLDLNKDGLIMYDEFMSWWTHDEESSEAEGEIRLGSRKTLKEKILSAVNSNEIEFQRIIEIINTRKRENGTSNTVCFKVYFNSAYNFNTVEGTASFDIGLCLWWFDENYIGKAEKFVLDPSDVWHPDIEFRDTVDVTEVFELEDCFVLLADLAKHGIIQYYQRYRCTVRQHQDLREFPFDQHGLTISFGSYQWSAQWIKFVDVCNEKNTVKILDAVDKLHEWKLIGQPIIREREFLDFVNGQEKSISEVSVIVPLERRSWYYIKNVFATIFCLNLMSWGVFTISPTDYSERLNLYLTLFLALVAFAFVVSDILPKVSHTTPITNYLTLNYVLIAATAVEGLLAYLVIQFDEAYTSWVTSFEQKFVIVIVLIQVLIFLRFYLRAA